MGGLARRSTAHVLGGLRCGDRRGLDYQETFRTIRPDFDLAVELDRRATAGQPETFGAEDLYPDARGCLTALRDLGLLVGLAGNQPAHAEATLRALDLSVDVIGTSHGWGVAKPRQPSSSGSSSRVAATRRRSCTSATGPTTTHGRPWRPG